MKAILMSIQPKWCAKIASGEKTIEIRKTRPKIETPFKCYIYMTLAKPYCYEFAGGGKMKAKNGKVIGEFVCDRMYGVAITGVFENGEQLPIDILKQSCLTVSEFHNYVGIKNCYGWHISELKIYDKPKELGEFSSALSLKDIRCKHIEKRYKTYNGKPYIKCTLQNCVCEFRRLGTQTDCDGYEMLKEPARLTKAPRSWCYVEELEEL